jgi:hypothetical protein
VSGYLARLEHSVEGDEAGVRPRLPSIFEPVGRVDVPAPVVGPPVEEIAPADERPSRVPAGSADRLQKRRETPAAVRVAERRDRVTAPPPVESERRRTQPAPARSPDRRDEEAEARAARADEPVGRSEPPRRVPIPTTVEAPAHVVAQPPPAARPEPEASPAPARAPKVVHTLDPIPGADVDRAPARPLVPPRTPPPTAAPVRSDRTTAPAAPILPAAALVPRPIPEPRRLRPAGPAEPPVVRITIGRIDVRAIPTATPTEIKDRPAPRKPAMSLEDYLARRNGRRS